MPSAKISKRAAKFLRRRKEPAPRPAPRVSSEKLDPSRTLTLRKSFAVKLKKQFALLKGRVVKLIVDENAFGLKQVQNVKADKPLSLAVDAILIQNDPSTMTWEDRRSFFQEKVTGNNSLIDNAGVSFNTV